LAGDAELSGEAVALLDAALLDVSGAGVFGPVVLGAGDLTDLLPLAEEVAPGEAGVEDSGRTVGLGDAVGCPAGGAAEDAVGASLDAEADAACGGVGDAEVQGGVVTVKTLWVAVLPAPELAAGGVLVGVGTAESVGLGVGAVVVGGTALGVGVAAGGVVGATEGITSGGDLLTFDGFLAAGEHVGVVVGLAAAFPIPPAPGAEPCPFWMCWPLPLLSAPPVPVLDVVLPDVDEVMLETTWRNPGTARAVPANRQTAAAATTTRSPAVPSRW
jgi:hypothetical protein